MAKGKLKRVKAPADVTFELVWADPASLTEHPGNWKHHPDFQTQAVGDLIERHGWLKPLVVNSRSGLLIDGHDRRKIAIVSKMPAVPVIVVDCPEESEPEILATLDPSGALAKGDPAALDRLMQSMRETTPALGTLVKQLAQSEGVLDLLKRTTAEAPPPAFVGPETTPASAPRTVSFQASGGTGVKKVILFFDAEQFREFRELADSLATDFDTKNDSDTVLAALRDTYEASQPAGA